MGKWHIEGVRHRRAVMNIDRTLPGGTGITYIGGPLIPSHFSCTPTKMRKRPTTEVNADGSVALNAKEPNHAGQCCSLAPV